ncbi:MAG: hypothetical protein PHW72_00725 [Candidatus Pacebacteria bacterium]|nr:hypothetical protein [Candidatus Paceibacterota bacterium]
MKNKGSIITLVLVFGSVFLILLSGLLGFILIQHRQSLQKVAWNEALNIAEAGINYAKWHLLHSPEDYDFEGAQEYADIGQFQLDIISPSGCDQAAQITSTGFASSFPQTQRKVRIKYSKPSLSQYAFLTDTNVWFGEEESLKGPVHSNGGIRMDGNQNSLFTSDEENYLCGSEHGCDPAEYKPGIWGAGQGQYEGLWQFPVPTVDFDLITQDLDTLKAEALASGIYITQPVDHGYHIRFNANGTMDVFRVKGVKQKVWGWNGVDWVYESNDIDNEEWQANYVLPVNCSPIFVENNVWVDGTVNGRAVLVAAELPEKSQKMKKIIINGNIDYADSGSSLGLISQSDVLIPLYSPDNLSISAAMLAQNGHVFRYYYPDWSSEPYNTYALRNSITTYGSIITKMFWTFSWVDDEEDVTSGYQNTDMNYDPRLTYSPPPRFPTSGEYEFLEWEEVK